MKLVKIATLLILFIFIVSGAFVGMAFHFNASPELIKSDDYFRISSGQNGVTIAGELEDLGFISSAKAFLIYTKIKGTGGEMKTGYYRIPAGSTMKQIHDLLLSGRQVLYSVTIPEGWTIRNIAQKLDEEGITPADEFIESAGNDSYLSEFGIETDSVEGFLFPDTYSFPLAFPAEKVIQTMVNNFFENLSEIVDYSSMVSKELYDKIILASIVEKEYRVADEAAMIASVFYNRLETGMSLGSCASVVYIITDILNKDHPDTIYYSDLEIESDYNTYIHEGLTPSPISNPGNTALKAAFYPEESDYYYFLLKDANAGQHYFSKTYGEHNQAYSLYIKKE
ncbi:MAG: endolytic transglycosylase MltG [Spirochaetales bacterium]|nr:endolytic transglycosylase MltG [Spirochaetales bacterium]